MLCPLNSIKKSVCQSIAIGAEYRMALAAGEIRLLWL
jgi:hypothetical protein